MFAFNDAWLINESLALHVSTNTFSNPAFDQDHFDGVNCGYNYPAAFAQPDTKPITGDAGKENGGDKRNRKEAAGKPRGQRTFTQTSLVDNLAFSIRSKLFVIDLNLKRKLNSLRAFAVRHFPRVFASSSGGKFVGKTFDGGSSHKMHGTSSRGACFMNRCRIHDSEMDEQFWENFVEPSSRKSLGKQKEKILSRLERVLEEKRSQSNLRNFYFNQHQQQTQQPQLKKTSQKLFGLPETNGLRHVRPGIVGRPNLKQHHSDSVSSCSLRSSSSAAATSSSSSLSSSTLGGFRHASSQSASIGGGGEPLVIGPQHWVSNESVETGGVGREVRRLQHFSSCRVWVCKGMRATIARDLSIERGPRDLA